AARAGAPRRGGRGARRRRGQLRADVLRQPPGGRLGRDGRPRRAARRGRRGLEALPPRGRVPPGLPLLAPGGEEVTPMLKRHLPLLLTLLLVAMLVASVCGGWHNVWCGFSDGP